jgi:Colicin immunity protein / pyocin immunity protein
MNKDELLSITSKLLAPKQNMSDEEVESLIERFVAAVPHPGGTDLIYHPQEWGLPIKMSAEQVVSEALSWKARIVSMAVIYVRQHPLRTELSCFGVELNGRFRTQIVSPLKLKVGDNCVVALSGARLSNGKVVTHGFVDRAFTAGEILGITDDPPGTEFALDPMVSA